MAGISIVFESGALDAAIARIAGLDDFDAGAMMESVGALGESQTRRRISDEKAGPDGAAWPANRAGTPTLVQTGRNLLASVAFTASADAAEWGAAWEFAHVHQFGAVIRPTSAAALAFAVPGGIAFAKQVTIPARPFVGLSTDNASEIEELVTDFLGLSP